MMIPKNELNDVTIATARALLDAGEVSSMDLTEACLAQIRGRDGAVHAFLDVYEESAREAAKRSDARRADGNVFGPLDGIPLALKDNMMMQGTRCTAGSKILETYVASYDATVTRKVRDQGAVILGKTNLDEFAMGSSTEHSAYGATVHPRDPDRVPGGSSGGSAAALAASMCLGSFGSDTGGSIRQPASFCGVVGLKPTYGRVSRSGLIAMASSLDQIGPFARSVEDAATLFSAIHGEDPKDQTTSVTHEFAWKPRRDLTGVRIGLPKQAWGEGMSEGVRQNVTAAVELMRACGAEICEVELPYADEALAVYYVLMPCEVSANLARFDGMRYGMRSPHLPLIETYAATRAAGFGAEARRRILLGTFALSKGYFDAYYLQAKKVQALIRRAYEAAFRDVDVLITPTAPTTAFKRGEKTADPLAMYLEDIFTVSVNVAGLPAVSVPCGDYEGLPVGVQMIGSWNAETELLGIAGAFEQAQKTV